MKKFHFLLIIARSHSTGATRHSTFSTDRSCLQGVSQRNLRIPFDWKSTSFSGSDTTQLPIFRSITKYGCFQSVARRDFLSFRTITDRCRFQGIARRAWPSVYCSEIMSVTRLSPLLFVQLQIVVANKEWHSVNLIIIFFCHTKKSYFILFSKQSSWLWPILPYVIR